MNLHSRAAPCVLALLLLAALPVPAQDDEPAIQILQTGPTDAETTIVYESGYKTGTFEPAVDTVRIKLEVEPSAGVKVNVASADPDQFTVTPAVLTFTTSNWATPQTVTLKAVDDDVREDLSSSVLLTATVDPTSAATEYRSADSASLLVTVVDNDETGFIITQSDSATQVNEASGQRTDTFEVVLSRRPLSDVVLLVAVPSSSASDVSVLPASLTFRPSNWNLPQTVTVSAVDDDLVEGAENEEVRVGIDTSTQDGQRVTSHEYLEVPTQSVAVAVVDDDDAAFEITQTDGSTATSEDEEEDSFTIMLARRPTSSVRVDIRSSDPGEVVLRQGTSGSFGTSTSITFSTTGWDDERTIQVKGVDDGLHDGHRDVEIVFSIDDARSPTTWRDLEDHVLVVGNQDNEKSVMVAPTELNLTEGQSDTYTVSLTRQPSASVTVEIDAEGVETNKPSVVFTTEDWETPKTVRVTATDDAQRTGDRVATINHTITSSDLAYQEDAQAASVTVGVTDDELYDLAASNRALQSTVSVDRSGDDNVVTWDLAGLEGDPVGVQVWRSSSPFRIATTIDGDGTGFAAQRFVDQDRDAEDLYIVTVFYGPTEQEGRFPSTASLDRVPGYTGLSQAGLEDLAASAEGDGLSPGAIAAIVILSLVALVVIIVVIVLVARRRPRDEPDERAEAWKEAGWKVEPRPRTGDRWQPLDEERPWRPLDQDRPDQEGWQPAAGHAPMQDQPGHDEPAYGQDAGPAAEHQATDQTYHLTCPRCRHAFTAVGRKPLTTRCPNCGVEGVLR